MLQKIEVSLQQLVERPTVSPERLAWAADKVNLFFGSFRKADADDPEVFTAGCTRLFTAYPPEAVAYVVDPVTGLPGRSEWLPSLRAVKEALDEWEADRRRERESEQRHIDADRQIAERKAWLERKTIAPTLDDLKVKYGPNWGLKEAEADKEAKRSEQLSKANRRAFETECTAAGFPLDSQASPSLIALIKGKSAAA